MRHFLSTPQETRPATLYRSRDGRFLASHGFFTSKIQPPRLPQSELKNNHHLRSTSTRWAFAVAPILEDRNPQPTTLQLVPSTSLPSSLSRLSTAPVLRPAHLASDFSHTTSYPGPLPPEKRAKQDEETQHILQPSHRLHTN